MEQTKPLSAILGCGGGGRGVGGGSEYYRIHWSAREGTLWRRGDYPLSFSVFIIHNEPIPFSLPHRSVTFKTGTHNL